MEFEEAKEFLARDIVFEDGGRVVKKLASVTPSPARAEHVKPGMELVQIKAVTPLGLGPPRCQFVHSSGENSDATKLLREFEETYRYRAPRPGVNEQETPNKFVDIVLTFKQPKVLYQTPVS